MNASHSKSAFFYAQVRQSLQAGHYLPGQRIDPATLASEFHTSPTPVRFALYRLVGEGLLEDHARGGLHVPLPTEIGLRNLYDWLQRMLLMACDIGFAPWATRAAGNGDGASAGTADVAERTWQLFDEIALATAHAPLHQAARRANDQLAPIRRAKQGLFEHRPDELAGLSRLWAARDIGALKDALRDYHERRKQFVPSIVAMLNTNASRFH